ncbi:MAG: hypothetical protein U0Z53_01880 [Blastocatellia bacterium]
MTDQQLNRLAALLALALILSPVAFAQSSAKQLAEAAQAELMAASGAYRASLARVLELQKQDETRAAELVAKRRALVALGAISRRELEETEQALAAAEARMSETRRQIEDADRLLAEVSVAVQPAPPPPAPQRSLRTSGALVRYVGVGHWALSDFDKVDAFFRLKFSRAIPVSAMGQTETHNRLGFDHRQAIDVAVHPDSAEGQALIGHLRSQGISFIAIRHAIPGSATGAHIHIGLPSKRLVRYEALKQ